MFMVSYCHTNETYINIYVHYLKDLIRMVKKFRFISNFYKPVLLGKRITIG